MIVLLFGPPGCGKGTQSALIASRYGIPAISTGEIFRLECQSASSIGRLARALIQRGELMPDELTNEIVTARLRQPDCRDGFLLDGYPRTVPQAKFLDQFLKSRGFPAPAVIHLEVSCELLVARLAARRQCSACNRIYNLISQPPARADRCDRDGARLVRRADDRKAASKSMSGRPGRCWAGTASGAAIE